MCSGDTPSRQNVRRMLWALLLLIISPILHISHLPYAEDDAYIHMRIAQHLWATGYPYFNHGDAVMASTAPLWILITAPATVLGSLQPLGIACLNALVLTTASWIWGVLLTQSLERNSPPLPHLGAASLTFVTLAPSSIQLMETPLALMLTGIAYLGVHAKRWWGIPAISLAPFVRPECAVFGVALFVYRLFSKRPWSILEVAACLLPVTFLFGFDLYFFSSIIPHTARAKDVVYDISIAEFIKFFCLGSYGSVISATIVPLSMIVVITGIIAFILRLNLTKLGAHLRECAEKVPLMVFILSPAIVIFFLYAIKHVLIFPWYTPLVLVPVYLGCLSLLKYRAYAIRMVSIGILFPSAVLATLLAGSCVKPELSPFFESGARARQLRALGALVYSAFPEARLMAPEIGALGFSFKGRIVDAVGLASPEALTFHPMKVPEERGAGFLGSVPAAFVDTEKPELMIGLSSLFKQVLATRTAADYDIIKYPTMCQEDLVRARDGAVFGSQEILVFRRKGVLAPGGTDIFAQGPGLPISPACVGF